MEMNDITAHKIKKALDMLGPNVLGVVRSLQSMGIRGKRACGDGCPIAKWLLRKAVGEGLREGQTFAVTSAYARLDQEYFELPGYVGVFIENFDAGYYPELEER
jgi:hypothetical protein